MDTDEDFGLFRGMRNGLLAEAIVAMAILLVIGSNIPDLIVDAVAKAIRVAAALLEAAA